MYFLKDKEDTLIVDEIFKHNNVIWFKTMIKVIRGNCIDYPTDAVDYFVTMEEFYEEDIKRLDELEKIENYYNLKQKYDHFRYFGKKEETKIVNLGNDKNWIEILYGGLSEQDCSSDKESWD